ncbi:hypothetical protein GTP45_01280 [Pseudoduganella sp. FT55W]|uniref:Uncharacterized protein n=1 Tax=Duganella rivi TaxID=2666083 RepID=A0A7X4GLW9_9BURK|nr:hypothetical protein [Duganella rivi]MYM65465.1 hypothetical protein [Duganella rivi]
MITASLMSQPGRWLPGAALAATAPTNDIPPMTDPLGLHWRQPADIRSAPMDDEFVRLTSRQVAGLLEYSSSYPSGTYDGKCWLRDGGAVQWLCWYGPHDEPGKISIEYRAVLTEEAALHELGRRI